MDIAQPHLGLSYDEGLGPELTEEFQAAVAAAGLTLRLDVRPTGRPMASLIWLAPTAVMIFAAKAYFESLSKELAKLHAPNVDKALQSLAKRAANLAFKSIGTKVAGPGDELYSSGFSLWTERQGGGRLKLLFPVGADAAVIDAANDAYMTFLAAYHGGTLNAEDRAILSEAQPVGGIVLLAYDPGSETIQVVDVLAAVRKAAR